MKFSIAGADAATGNDTHTVVEAHDEAAALAMAKGQGIFVSRVTLAEPAIITPPGAPTGPAILSPALATGRRDKNGLPDIFNMLALLNFIAAAFGLLAVFGNHAGDGLIVFASCGLSGFFLLAIAKVLDYLSESVKQLRQIAGYLESKS